MDAPSRTFRGMGAEIHGFGGPTHDQLAFASYRKGGAGAVDRSRRSIRA